LLDRHTRTHNNNNDNNNNNNNNNKTTTNSLHETQRAPHKRLRAFNGCGIYRMCVWGNRLLVAGKGGLMAVQLVRLVSI
jgi:hypothetical protein